MDEIIEYLEKKIKACDELGGMELEKFAFVVTLKKVRKIAMNYTRCCESDSEQLTDKMEKLHGHTLKYWKNNAEEDYLKVPISVLKYITCLEERIEQLILSGVGKNKAICNCENEYWKEDEGGDWYCTIHDKQA